MATAGAAACMPNVNLLSQTKENDEAAGVDDARKTLNGLMIDSFVDKVKTQKCRGKKRGEEVGRDGGSERDVERGTRKKTRERKGSEGKKDIHAGEYIRDKLSTAQNGDSYRFLHLPHCPSRVLMTVFSPRC